MLRKRKNHASETVKTDPPKDPVRLSKAERRIKEMDLEREDFEKFLDVQGPWVIYCHQGVFTITWAVYLTTVYPSLSGGIYCRFCMDRAFQNLQRSGTWLRILPSTLPSSLQASDSRTPVTTPGDAGGLTASICNLSIAQPPGYPLYTLLGKLASYIYFWCNPALKANMFSVTCSSLSAAYYFHAVWL